jgi:excisionase family DNA binding protein
VLLIDVREAARRVGLSKDTVYALIAADKFPYKRIGIGNRKVIRVPVKALESWSAPDAVE